MEDKLLKYTTILQKKVSLFMLGAPSISSKNTINPQLIVLCSMEEYRIPKGQIVIVCCNKNLTSTSAFRQWCRKYLQLFGTSYQLEPRLQLKYHPSIAWAYIQYSLNVVMPSNQYIHVLQKSSNINSIVAAPTGLILSPDYIKQSMPDQS